MYNYTLYYRVYKDKGENIMKTLEKVNNSFELFELLNKHRIVAGEKPYRTHHDLVVKIRRELGDLDSHENVEVENTNKNSNFTKVHAIILSRKDVYVVSMRESKNVRSSVYDYIEKLEEEAVEQQRQHDLMKDIVWKVIKDKSYLGRIYALQSAGVKHPRLFLRYLKENGKFHTDVHERGLLKHQYVSPNTLVEMFTRKGFEWLLANKGNLDTWVEKQKVLEKQRKVLPC